ncbi:MAG: tetratricopeptide repeat protein, partial [Phycisphaerae bacterium]
RKWELDLARSLLYVEADRFTSNILFRGGTSADYDALRPLMDRAVGLLQRLYTRLDKEYEGLDDVTTAEYERIERSGRIARLEQDLALVDYWLAWARFYRALSRDVDDRLESRSPSPQRDAEYQVILEYLDDRSKLLSTAHSSTHHQAQALLLAGMIDRRMERFPRSLRRLGHSIDVVSSLIDDNEQRELDWVATLARVELVRCFRDAGHFQAAREALKAIHLWHGTGPDPDFSKSLIIALLERDALRAEADRLESTGRRPEADNLRLRAVAALADLAKQQSAYRDEIYATLYGMLGAGTDVDSLTPFERCAVVAGALGDADVLSGTIDELQRDGQRSDDDTVMAHEKRRADVLDRAISIARTMTLPGHDIAPELHAEAMYNLAVAYYRRGRRLDAASSFLAVAGEHQSFIRSQDAATFAVQLAWEMHQDAALAARPDVRALYLNALTTLTDTYPESESARYWVFFLGQHLARLERYEEAGGAYARVGTDHERFYEAIYLAAEARVRSLKRFAEQHANRIRDISRRATAAIRSARDAQGRLDAAVASAEVPMREMDLRRLGARCNVLIGEACAVKGVNRWAQALSTLEGFESRYPSQAGLIGRVLRTRMIALESLGRVEEASRLIPQYVASDPKGAVPTLQGLFDALHQEIERDNRAGLDDQARAASAVVIAEGMHRVALDQPDRFGPEAVYALRLQLAESLMEAGQVKRAKKLFAKCLAQDQARYNNGQPRDSRAILGSAQAHFQLEEYAEALPLFNRVFRGAAQGHSDWWQALLRDLQCRTELGHDASQIIKVIHQRKFLDGRMGGPKMRRKFDALLARNERRIDPSPDRQGGGF